MEYRMTTGKRACRSTGSRFQKRKRSGRVQTNIKRLRAEMAEIVEQQKRISEGQMEMRESVQEIVCEYDQLRKERLLISKQAARYQRSLNEMVKIVIAGENSNLSEADGLIQCLRECMKHDMENNL
ncbi:hypothetical protein OIU85_029746 [Salix viminalis]|uniref:Uncharacterized protein n=1 Tax=Salix viminalis TaxID=40686 RepID=A0A9Q0QC10_SALVM|nr:hypothetical protein OIU85_029746 [Salix viminalis]